MTYRHPFLAVAALDKAGDARLRLVHMDNGVTRLSDEEAGLWVMIARENGSIMDRWAADSEMEFLMLDDEAVSAGPESILTAIRQAGQAARANRSGAGQ